MLSYVRNSIVSKVKTKILGNLNALKEFYTSMDPLYKRILLVTTMDPSPYAPEMQIKIQQMYFTNRIELTGVYDCMNLIQENNQLSLFELFSMMFLTENEKSSLENHKNLVVQVLAQYEGHVGEALFKQPSVPPDDPEWVH